MTQDFDFSQLERLHSDEAWTMAELIHLQKEPGFSRKDWDSDSPAPRAIYRDVDLSWMPPVPELCVH